jgi:adenylate cyclase class 2
LTSENHPKTDKNQEQEVKYYLGDLPSLEARLKSLRAKLIQARTHETNLRFDLPDGSLTQTYQVLRLRQDSAARMTYKGPSRYDQGVRVRQEIEFRVSDFEAARALFEALGYQVSMMYEKYRTTYELDGVQVTLDEMPYGNFAELEGPNPQAIQAANQRLGLDWDARVPESYTALFDLLKAVMRLDFRDLSFENFKDLEVPPSAMNLRPADI